MQVLAFDSYFHTYKGVVTHVRVFNGELKPGMEYGKRALIELMLGKNVCGTEAEAEAILDVARASEMLWLQRTSFYDLRSDKEIPRTKVFLNPHHPRVQVCSIRP